MLYGIKELTEDDYKKECARLLIAFENPNYKQENTIHIAKNVTIGYGLDLLKCDGEPKDFLLDYLPDNSKKLKIGDEELTFYEIIKRYKSNQKSFTEPNAVKGYLQNKVFNFSLTQEQAQKVLENMIPRYEKRLSSITTNYLPYSKERASLLSMRYLGKEIEKNGLIKAIKNNSRFISWFIIRYKTNINTYLGYISRSCDEADIYLSNPNINQIKLIFDIFSYLNIKKETICYREYELNKNIQNFTAKTKEDTLLNLALWYENDLDFIRFNEKNQVSKISKSNISNIVSNLTKKSINNITQILSPYLTYINTNFAKGSVSEYALENIYVLNEVKDTEQLNIALNQRKDTKSLTPLLIICLKPKTQAENTDAYTIKQSQNTFLSIVVFEGAKLDISKLNSDESEIIYARNNQEKIEAFLLQGSCQSMQQRNNTLTIQGNSNETYLFDKQPQADNAISPILKVYKEANEKGYIEIHNFAKETLADSTTYILGNDSRQRYSGITLFLNENTKPHNTDCSNEGNFKVIVQNLHLYGLKENEKLFLYNCENRKELLSTITSDYTALFYPVLDLPEQDEHSQRTQSSHIVLSTKEMAENANIQHQTTTTNPNFQINRQAKLSQRYIITDAKLNTKKPPLQNKSKVLVQSVSFKDKKYIHYKANDTLTFQAHYNKLSQEQLKEAKANTKWAYILSTDEILPQKPDYKKITQEGSDSPYIGEDYTLTLKKEYFDINKATYLHIFAYINAPSSKVKQVLKLEYPLSLRFNGKELQILEWGEVKRDKLDSNIFDKKRIFQARSGKPIPIASQNNTNTQNNNTNYIGNLILNPDNPQEYFDYSKQRQKEKDKGAIPEGIYYIDINKSKNDKSSGIRTYDNAWYSLSRNKEGEKWGKYNIPIYINKECTNTIESTTQRNNFYIHGGESYGDNGGIDLAKEDTRFFKVLESIKKDYKDILESLKDNEGRMVVRLGVGYGERKSEIDLRGKRTPNGGVVEWISQFDNTKGGMGTKAGNTACKLTCDEILRRSGVSLSETPTSYRGSILYQISIEKDVAYYRSNDTHKRISDGNLNTKEQNEYLDYDERILREGLKYIDTELEKGYPITIGVDHTYQHKGGFNSDLSTDHFVVIVGRKYDEKGKLYYLFYEVGTRYKDKGISDDNRFYIENNTLHGTPAHNMNRHYVVTQIRRNLSYKKD